MRVRYYTINSGSKQRSLSSASTITTCQQTLGLPRMPFAFGYVSTDGESMSDMWVYWVYRSGDSLNVDQPILQRRSQHSWFRPFRVFRSRITSLILEVQIEGTLWFRPKFQRFGQRKIQYQTFLWSFIGTRVMMNVTAKSQNEVRRWKSWDPTGDGHCRRKVEEEGPTGCAFLPNPVSRLGTRRFRPPFPVVLSGGVGYQHENIVS